MKVKEVKTWKFEELTEEQQEKAIENYYDFNVDDSFWCEEWTEDNLDIGLKVTSFDIGRGAYCKIDCQKDFQEIAENIQKTFGKEADITQTATNFLKSRKEIIEHTEDNEPEYLEDIEEVEEEFERELEIDILQQLKDSYEYNTSKEAISESLIANDYDFTSDSKIF
tara:strand:+ start:202 stop:702 length:501 start_codon:yes stop_codon:yes gene_type:complete